MPVDRELAYESLKWIDPKVYKIYLRLRYRGMTSEQVKNDAKSLYKLKMVMLTNEALDELEERGLVEIVNDYENERILVKRNQFKPERDEHSFVV